MDASLSIFASDDFSAMGKLGEAILIAFGVIATISLMLGIGTSGALVCKAQKKAAWWLTPFFVIGWFFFIVAGLKLIKAF